MIRRVTGINEVYMFSPEILFFLACCCACVLFLLHAFKKGNEEVAAVRAWCAAGDCLMEWREANPSVPIAHSEEARQLVRNSIGAYVHFLRMHPTIRARLEYLEYLHGLLNDRGTPSRPPGKSKRPPSTQQLASASCSLFVTLIVIRSNFLGTVRW
jgi:hypothetical protein